MAIKLISAVWDIDGVRDPRMLLVLLALADHCNDEGVCWPSMARIAQRARCSERQAKRVVAKLCELKASNGEYVLQIIAQGGGRRKGSTGANGSLPHRGRTHWFKLNVTAMSLFSGAKGDTGGMDTVSPVTTYSDMAASPEPLVTANRNRQGKQTPKSQTTLKEKNHMALEKPRDLAEGVLIDCSIVGDRELRGKVDQVIEFISRDENCSKVEAKVLLTRRIKAAQQKDNFKFDFFLRDQKWRVDVATTPRIVSRRPRTPAEKLAEQDAIA
jgi:hypothetical protein